MNDSAEPGVVVGRVVGTEDSTPLSFSLALAPEPVSSSSTTSSCATGTLPERRHGHASRASSTRSARATKVRGSTPTCSSSRTACCPRRPARSPTYSPPESSPRSSCRRSRVPTVRRAEGKEREQALYFDQMERRLPIGLDHRDEPLYANLEFIDGSRGAHVNISGISGVATKTTYATFLLFSLFNSGVLGAEAINTKALIFNVKGEDLLFLDHANARLTEHDRERYRRDGAGTEAVRLGRRVRARRERTIRTLRPTSRPAPPACTPTTGRSPSSSRRSCCPSSSPTRRTSGSSTRW